MGAGINALIAGGIEPIKIEPFTDRMLKQARLSDVLSQQRERDAMTEERKQLTADKVRSANAQRTLGELLSKNTTQDDQGRTTVNHDAIEAGMSAAGYGAEALQYGKFARDEQKSQIENEKDRLANIGKASELLGSTMSSLSQVPDEQLPQAYEQNRVNLLRQGVIGPQQAPPADFLLKNGGVAALRQQVNQLGAAGMNSKEQTQVQLDRAKYAQTALDFEQAVREKAPDTAKKWNDLASTLYSAAPDQLTKDNATHRLKEAGAPQSVIDQYVGSTPAQAQQMGMTAEQKQQAAGQTQTREETARHNLAEEGLRKTEVDLRKKEGQAISGALTQQGLDVAAEQFAKTGQLPFLGMGAGGGAARTAIINRAAVLHPALDVSANKADYDANKASLKALTQTQDRVNAFETTAGKNIDVFLNAAGKVIDTGSPLLNAPLRMLSDKVLGSENMAALKAARETALTEAAKVLESPGGNQALTVSGRDALKTLSDINAPLRQQIAAMKILRTDMTNRKRSNDDQISAIRNRIGGKSSDKEKDNDPLGIR